MGHKQERMSCYMKCRAGSDEDMERGEKAVSLRGKARGCFQKDAVPGGNHDTYLHKTLAILFYDWGWPFSVNEHPLFPTRSTSSKVSWKLNQFKGDSCPLTPPTPTQISVSCCPRGPHCWFISVSPVLVTEKPFQYRCSVPENMGVAELSELGAQGRIIFILLIKGIK